jgi:predicted GH43/DUF377 family glycosyl hydrolase
LLLFSHINRKEKVMKNLLALLFFVIVLTLGAGKVHGQFVWTKDVRNPILTGGAAGTWNRHVATPSVLYNTDSARYEMWFGASVGATSDYRPFRVGFAISKDGVNWTMNPSAVLSPDPGAWDAYTIELPMVLRENKQYKMWYAGWSAIGLPKSLGYATSSDGIHWTKYPGNPVMGPGKATWEAFGPYGVTVLPFPGGYKMWYGGTSGATTSSSTCNIGYAISTDGITWQRDTVNNPVLKTGATGQWDDTYLTAPQVLRIGNTYYMWYSGGRIIVGNTLGVGVATSKDSGKTWTKYATNPVLPLSQSSWDGTYIMGGTVLLRGDTLDMWYHGSWSAAPTFLWKIGHATSSIVSIGVAERNGKFPGLFMLSQNYPNSFNPATVISYQVAVSGYVTLKIFDILGREVAALVNERKDAGRYSVQWDAARFVSGIYFCRLKAGQFTETKKMILMK